MACPEKQTLWKQEWVIKKSHRGHMYVLKRFYQCFADGMVLSEVY